MPLPPPHPGPGFRLAGSGRPSLQLSWERRAKGSESQPHNGAFKFVLWALLRVSAEWAGRGGEGAGGSRGVGGAPAPSLLPPAGKPAISVGLGDSFFSM